jgi:superoxide dismutase, Fe-Mn family
MKYMLPKLSYSYDALEPYIDAKTMEIHHSKHHQAYTDNLNKALEKYPKIAETPIEDLLNDLSKIPEDIRTAVRNNGGGFVNHSFFWEILKKDAPVKGKVIDAINKEFGSFDKFKEQFSSAALTRFGSGWAWLVLNKEGKLEIMSTANQDSPVSEGKTPLLTIDIWEHAYYLKFQNRRAEYISTFFNVINWYKVNELYEKEISKK